MADKIVDMLCELVQVDSESGSERSFMEYLSGWLKREVSASCELDVYGNLIARVAAKDSKAAPVMLGAHGDTVRPGCGIRPRVVDGRVCSSGDTILGADDKAGIAEIARAVQTARRRPPVEIVITVGEEVGLLGARNLDLSKVRAKQAFIVDGEKLEEVIIGGPTHINLDVTIRGRAAHAGMSPEKGISAIRVAAVAISRMPEGRIDFETTANVGVIEGGLIRNGVPETAKVTAECRSLNHEKALKQARAMREAFETAAREAGAQVEIKEEIEYEARSIDPASPIVQRAMNAVRAAGLTPVAKPITGGTDALILSNRGLDAVVLGLGSEKAHTTEEFVPVAALEKGAEILRNLLESLA
jgi:tripeptide aminopeptidase